MDWSSKTDMREVPVTIESRHGTLQPVNDPDYKGLFHVKTYQDYYERLLNRVHENGTTNGSNEKSNGK